MANRNLADLRETPEGYLIAKRRRDLAMVAGQEIEVLSFTLRNVIPTAENPDLLVRGISARLEALGQVVMSALGDEVCETDSLHYDIYGRGLPQ